MRKAILIFILLRILILLGGCSNSTIQENTLKEIKFFYQDGTPALTSAKLAFEDPILDKNIKIIYQMQRSPELLLTKILKQEADIAIVPSNIAAQAVNKGLSYKIIGTAVWGSLYLTSTEDINNFEELKGKEIYSFGKGLTPDLVLNIILNKNGLDIEKDVKVTYLSAASEVGSAFIGGKTNLALLAEPLLTTVMIKKPDAKIIFDLNEEWGKVAGLEHGYPQSSLIISEDLLESNPKLIEKFIKAYEESRNWAYNNPKRLAEYAEKLEIGVTKDAIEKGIRWTNIETFNIKDCKEEYNIFYKAIIDFALNFIGGKMPDERIYFER